MRRFSKLLTDALVLVLISSALIARPAFAEADILDREDDAVAYDEAAIVPVGEDGVDPVYDDASDIESESEPVAVDVSGDEQAADAVDVSGDEQAADEADDSAGESDDVAAEPLETGWIQGEDGISFRDPATGELLVGGFHEIEGSTYYFDGAGIRASGWREIEGNTFYFDSEDGCMYSDGIFDIDGDSFYFRPSGSSWGPEGSLGKGWVHDYGDNSDSFFFNRSTGKMITGDVAVIDGAHFRFNDDGSMYRGWYESESGDAYYYDEANGRMLSDDIVEVDGESYYFRPAGSSWGPEGSLGYGWVRNHRGFSYFFNRVDGTMLKDGIFEVDGESYYFRPADSPWGPEGSLGYGWVTDYGDAASDYFFDRKSGRMLVGRAKVDGFLYFFDSNGATCSSWVEDANSKYYCGDDGRMLVGGIYEVDGESYYFRPAGSPWGPEGSMGYGWVRDYNGYSFFFNRSDGTMCKNGIFEVDGSSYYFRPLDSPYGPEGSMGKGWVLGYGDNGEDYFFDRKTGAMAVNGIFVIDRHAFSADEYGHLTRMSVGQDLANASAAQKRVATYAWAEPTTPSGWCAMWIHNIFEEYGITDVNGNANDLYNNYCTSTNLDDLQVGMIVAVSRHPGTAGGRIYGHIGIYVGDGVLLDSSGSVRTWYVQDWINSYNGWVPAKWGWYGGRKLS